MNYSSEAESEELSRLKRDLRFNKFDKYSCYDRNLAHLLHELIEELSLTKVAIFRPSGKLESFTMSFSMNNLQMLHLEEVKVDLRESKQNRYD